MKDNYFCLIKIQQKLELRLYLEIFQMVRSEILFYGYLVQFSETLLLPMKENLGKLKFLMKC